jgi:divalent metal cation (Fe/Co/Zn/Cd) transporter
VETILFRPARKDYAVFYRWATALALITIFYNLIEGIVSVLFGFEDGTVSLFGFGIDSFVEVISGVGIWHMVRRMRRNPGGLPDRFEATALRITGSAFYLLSAGLVVTAAANISLGKKPETTFWGIVVSAVSIVSMVFLMKYKVKIGRWFNSEALLADAACTKTCIYLSVVLLAASLGFALTGIGMIDSLGAAGIAVLSFREGREAFGKARGEACSCQGGCG